MKYTLIIIFLLIIILIKIMLPIVENSMIFIPFKLEQNDNMNIKDNAKRLKNSINENIIIEEHFVNSKNKNRINLIIFKNPNTENHILFCHGNAGNIKNRQFIFDIFGPHSSITLFDYQGYGKSEGKPNEKNVYDDAFSVWKFLVKKQKIDPKNITIYGKSLGGAVASNLVNRICNHINGDYVNPHGLIIESSFSDFNQIANDIFPSLSPLFKIILNSKFDSKDNVKKIGTKTNILIAHSPEDEIIPFKHAHKLYHSCNKKNSQFVKLNGSHNNIIYDEKYTKLIKNLLRN